MKVRNNIFILMALCLAAYTDNSYKGIESEMNTGEQLPVHIIVGDADEIVEAKGSGAMEDDDPQVWEGKTINVFAFRREVTADYSIDAASGNDDCLIDGSLDQAGNLGGKEANVNDLDSYITWKDPEEVIYYRTDDHPYDFFAYYIDQQTPDSDIYRTKDEVRIMMDIDGHQDVMSAYASLTEEQLSRPGYTDMDKAQLETYSFSAYSAKRNIHPVFYFKHHLTRIDFEMSAGSEDSENIMIDSIVVQSKSKAIFTVAHKNPTSMGMDFSISRDYKGLALPEADGSKLKLDTWHPEMGDDGQPVRKKIGGSLLLAPDNRYQLSIHVKENKLDGSVLRYENRMSLTSPEGHFGEGNQYVVHLTVYGLEEISINVELKKWVEGGDYIYNEEDYILVMK